MRQIFAPKKLDKRPEYDRTEIIYMIAGIRSSKLLAREYEYCQRLDCADDTQVILILVRSWRVSSLGG